MLWIWIQLDMVRLAWFLEPGPE